MAHTVALFLLSTIRVAMDQYTTSIELINNRNFPGTDKLPPGPLGYDYTLSYNAAFTATRDVAFPLNQWLADGLLVRPVLLPVNCVPYSTYSSSYIVATSFIP